MLKVILDRVKQSFVLYMVRDLSLPKETEQFSFIRTITIYPDRDLDEPKQFSVTEANSSEGKKQNAAGLEQSDLAKDEVKSDRNITKYNSASAFLSVNNPMTISNHWYSTDEHLATVVVVPELQPKNQLGKKDFNHYLDKILLIFAGGYLCFVLWWLFGAKNAIFPLAFLSKQAEISQADTEFIDYMERSLDIIDRKVEDKLASEPTENASESKNSQVVYVPVYTPNSTATSNNKTDLPQPLAFLPPPPPPNQLAAMNTLSSIPIKSPAPPSESVENKTIPATSSNDTQAVKSDSQIALSQKATATIKPNVAQTLVGVMELKEGSAALFKIDGVTQRVWLGEKIENTDWVLDSIANQKVKIISQGKSLTLSVGETF